MIDSSLIQPGARFWARKGQRMYMVVCPTLIREGPECPRYQIVDMRCGRVVGAGNIPSTIARLLDNVEAKPIINRPHRYKPMELKI